MISASLVKELREKTGAGMMDCKKALVEAEGNQDKAVEILREKGIAKAAKKQGRIAAEGVVASFVEGNTGVLVEINCESDFVAKGEKFKELAQNVGKTIATNKPASVEELNDCTMENGVKVSDYITEQTIVIGEKISIRRFEIYTTVGKVETYIHMGGKVGVMVEANPFTSGEAELHDVALQIAAAKPSYVRPEEVPADVIEKEKEILIAQLQNDEKNANKPREILEKIVTDLPAPKGDKDAPFSALIFDSYYDPYKGVIVYFRVMNGKIKAGDKIKMMATGAEFDIVEIGRKGATALEPCDVLEAGEVGYLSASIKTVSEARVGDTITLCENPVSEPLEGYRKVNPVVFCGIYPADGAKYPDLR